MEKNAILAVALSILVFIAFQYYQQHYMSRPVPVRPAAQTAAEPVLPPPQAPPQQLEAAAAGKADTAAAAQTVVIMSDIYRAVINNRGAVLTSWELSNYKSAQNRVFEIIAASRDGGNQSYPGSLIFPDQALTAQANNEFYQVSILGEPSGEKVLVAPATVALKLKWGDLTIEKRYTFDKANYLVDLAVTCEKGGRALEGEFLIGEDLGPEREHLLSSSKLEAVYYAGGKVRREAPPKNEQEIRRIDGDVRWVGLGMQYFAMITIPDRPLPYIEIQRHPVKAVDLDGKEVDRDLLRVTTPVSGSLQYQMYLGPKRQSNLEAVKSADITGVINYGMFAILVLPLLASLRLIYQFVHNYGYAIIVLTFLLSLLLFPFRLKQMISMKKMQVVQPKVKAIQDKYRRYKKTDPKRAEMNQEIMALYKEHNVNPLGGCLPLILQFPLLIAFYQLLANSIELRQAPFFWWLHDLSAKDPYYVLPIIMGITMFISQKMTPMTPGTDPAQAKMMMAMPVIFTLMFFNVSSGLNLYFLCSNIFQVGFQKIAARWMGDGQSSKS